MWQQARDASARKETAKKLQKVGMSEAACEAGRERGNYGLERCEKVRVRERGMQCLPSNWQPLPTPPNPIQTILAAGRTRELEEWRWDVATREGIV